MSDLDVLNILVTFVSSDTRHLAHYTSTVLLIRLGLPSRTHRRHHYKWKHTRLHQLPTHNNRPFTPRTNKACHTRRHVEGSGRTPLAGATFGRLIGCIPLCPAGCAQVSRRFSPQSSRSGGLSRSHLKIITLRVSLCRLLAVINATSQRCGVKWTHWARPLLTVLSGRTQEHTAADVDLLDRNLQ